MTTEGCEDGFRLATLATGDGLPHGSRYGMGRLGCRYDALGLGKLDGSGETLPLGNGNRLDQTQFVHMGNQRRHAVVAQPPGMNGLWNEAIAQGVHFHQGR